MPTRRPRRRWLTAAPRRPLRQTAPDPAPGCRAGDRRSPRPSTDLQHAIDRRVAAHGQPAPAARRMEPALGRDAGRVLEDPDLVEVAIVGIRQRIGHGAALAAERELVDRAMAAARAVEA